MSKYYLRIEGVNIGNFVYDTQDLSTVRGGGLLLLDSAEWVQSHITAVDLKPLSTGASSGLFLFDAPDEAAATAIRDEVWNLLKSDGRLKHATFVVDLLPSSGDYQFIHDRELILAMNRWQQMQSVTVAVPGQNLDDAKSVCNIDQVRPAATSFIGPEKNTEWISESVERRRGYGREMKQAFYKKRADYTGNRDFVREFEELTDDKSKGNLHHKMAVIYIDGNNFGKIQIAGCKTQDSQKQFDTILKNYRKEFLNGLISGMANDPDWISKSGNYRIETLVWGGDEILLVVPAWKGWETLSFFFEKSKKWKVFGSELHHAAGLVFSHHNAPIQRVKNLAKALADLAKEKDRKQSLFAYEVLESFDHIGRELVSYRKERSLQPLEPGEEPDPNLLILNENETAGLGSYIKVLKRFLPRRKLQDIVRNLSIRSSALTTSQLGRERKEALDAAAAILNSDPDYRQALTDLREPPDQLSPSDQNARWLHLAALWDYIA